MNESHKVADADTIRRLNEKAYKVPGWRAIRDSDILYALDDEGTNMVAMHTLNGDSGVHVLWYLKLMASDEPDACWITMDLEDFNNLPTVSP